MIKTDCKVLCMVFLEDLDMVLMGLISKELVAYHSMKQYLWSVKLKDSILHMVSVRNPHGGYIMYCALANGCLTYIEINSLSQPCDIFDVNVSINPLNYIEQITDEENLSNCLWIASVNEVYVLNQKLLSNESKFQVAENQYGPIQMLKRSKYGVFLSIKDSSILHLYDIQTHRCKLLFDLRLNIKLNIDTDDDFCYAKSRLTCYLPFDDMILVGTGDGFLFIYSIERFEKKKLDKFHKKFSLRTPMLKHNNYRRNFSIVPQLLEKILENKTNRKSIKRNFSLPSVLNKAGVGSSLRKTNSHSALKTTVAQNDFGSLCHFKFRIHKNEEKNYDFNMNLVTKVKISDQPVKSILWKKINNQDLVFTCSGSYGDDETLLKWTRNTENNWINEPFIEICPYTNVPKRPMYAKIEYFQNLKRKN